MKGIWKDGRVKFYRDNNIKHRGLYGHGIGDGRFEWIRRCGAGRAFVSRQVHKAERRQVQVLIEEQFMDYKRTQEMRDAS